MCGPAVAWDWFILDVAYILLLVGGAAVLRARSSSLLAWVWFGVLSVAVGSFLFAGTYAMQTTAAAASAETSTVVMLAGC